MDQDDSNEKIKEPDFAKVVDILTKSPQEKKKLTVTFEQREMMLNFISENPELVTHSSTKESEKALWEELVNKLNCLEPQKNLAFWRKFWSRWICSLNTKPKIAFTLIDYRLQKFLSRIGYKDEEDQYNTKKLDIKEIQQKLNDIEEQKMGLKLEIDEIDYKILKYQSQINSLKSKLKEKRKHDKKLTSLKVDLFKRKKILEEKLTFDPKEKS